MVGVVMVGDVVGVVVIGEVVGEVVKCIGQLGGEVKGWWSCSGIQFHICFDQKVMKCSCVVLDMSVNWVSLQTPHSSAPCVGE